MAKTIEILERDDIGDAVEHVLRNSEIVSDAVDQYVRDQELLTKDDVDLQITDALDNRGLLDEDDVERIVRDMGYASDDDVLSESEIEDIVDRRVAALDNEDVVEMQRRVTELERRLDTYAQRVDSQVTRHQQVLIALRDLINALLRG